LIHYVSKTYVREISSHAGYAIGYCFKMDFPSTNETETTLRPHATFDSRLVPPIKIF